MWDTARRIVLTWIMHTCMYVSEMVIVVIYLHVVYNTLASQLANVYTEVPYRIKQPALQKPQVKSTK